MGRLAGLVQSPDQPLELELLNYGFLPVPSQTCLLPLPRGLCQCPQAAPLLGIVWAGTGSSSVTCLCRSWTHASHECFCVHRELSRLAQGLNGVPD